MKVSIITPVYNTEPYLAETIESVLAQSHDDWELLLTDDHSTDGSVEKAEQFSARDSRIKSYRLDDQSRGAAAARNHAIQRATGDVIAFLDSDDIWDSSFLSESLTFMERHSAAIVYSSYRRKSADLSVQLGEFIVPETATYHSMLKTCVISCLTGMYHVGRCNGKVFMPDIERAQDYGMWLELLRRGGTALGQKKVLATYRILPNSLSRNKIAKAKYQWLIYRRVEQLSLPSSVYYFFYYAVNGLAKNFRVYLK